MGRKDRIRGWTGDKRGKVAVSASHGHEQIQTERQLRRLNRFDKEAFFRERVVPSPEQGWYYLLVHGGDVSGRMIRSHTRQLAESIKVVLIDGVPHTVVRLSDKTVYFLRQAKTLKGFYNSFLSILSESDVREFFNEIWVAGHNVLAMIERQTEMYRRKEAKNKEGLPSPTGSGGIAAIVREMGNRKKAVRFYGSL